MDVGSRDAVISINIPFVSDERPFQTGHCLVGDREARMRYLDALAAEARAVAPEAAGCTVRAVKVVGPSPSIMSPDALGALLREVRQLFDVADGCEVGIEAAPHTVGVPSLTGWGQGKVNRVVLRADSVQPEELAALQRPFDSVQVQNALLFLERFHLGNVDVALRYGIPGQTEASLMRTLRSVAGIEPAHLTLEPLLATEEGVADEEVQRRLYEAACERLSSYGFEQYAVGRFARDAAHREAFATALGRGAQLVGLGIDARSVYGSVAYVNTSDYAAYVAHSADARETVAEAAALDAAARARLFVRTRLACGGGFTADELAAACGPLDAALARELDELEQAGLLERAGGASRLTRRGMFAWAR